LSQVGGEAFFIESFFFVIFTYKKFVVLTKKLKKFNFIFGINIAY
tara:strand:+ start:1075 stop:1209 length:135 start_codon:yes stop_codon:yes gene_type:complete